MPRYKLCDGEFPPTSIIDWQKIDDYPYWDDYSDSGYVLETQGISIGSDDFEFMQITIFFKYLFCIYKNKTLFSLGYKYLKVQSANKLNNKIVYSENREAYF